MSLFGKVVAVLNIVAAGAFLYLGLMDYQARKNWSYAVYRYDIGLKGTPADKADSDVKGRPLYLDMNEALAHELVGNDKLVTQEDVLQDLRSSLQNKIEDNSIKGTKVDKYVEVLLPLADSAAEREFLINYRSNRANQDYAKLSERFNAIFDKALQTKDRDGKRSAIARIMVNLIGVLPTEEEKKQRADKKYDPTADPAFRRVLNTIGERAMARALDLQARVLMVMAQDVAAGRDQERLLFVERHQSLFNTILDRAHKLGEVTDQLEDKKAQVDIQTKRAKDQEDLVAKVKGQHDKAQTDTAKQLDRLAAQQQKLFEVRVRLRDANRINQEMELLVRKLEEEYRSKQREQGADTMERLGKILVFAHLGLSLLLASWAMSLYLNRTDWTAQKGKDGKPDGELVQRIAEYDNLAKTGIRPAETRLLANRQQLAFQEGWRPYERAWYATQLAILRGDVAGPIVQLARGPDGSVLMDPTYGQPGRTNVLQVAAVPIKGPDGKPLELKPLSFYKTTIDRTVDDLLKATAELKKQAERDAAFTNQLKGPKGLHARLLFEKRKYDEVVEEYKAVRPKWLNNTVELRELEELRQRLDERVRELTTTKVSRRP